ncbi:hypothetical protein BOH77_0136 [Staphylococcus aureus M1057]|nr:hypothetical protein CA347_2581 [Staphylococcus aureus CA-347]AWE61888.1 hypothetical protein CSC49_0457 [Staphylococcus aureus]EHT72490.1 hypothetical protein SACIG290_0390 [Staphylococcus aureus subsp. aureus CIG290]EHT80238.1 hypothetical protein SACIG1524_0323 [Staphylococcus aureus subsp. aureus CIG1524]OMK07315.1 hypothetical protein BOH77_0136 [Staphylococcus aureus M1057]
MTRRHEQVQFPHFKEIYYTWRLIFMISYHVDLQNHSN